MVKMLKSSFSYYQYLTKIFYFFNHLGMQDRIIFIIILKKSIVVLKNKC